MKHTFVTLFAALGVSTFAIHCGSSGADCNETRTCAPDPGDGGPDAEGGADVVVVPDGCDLTKDAKDAPRCVVNEVGVFVDGAGGSDVNAGTKESPVKSIGAALAKLGGKTRVYVCEGTYEESVKLASAVSVYGGFVCAGWSHAGGKSSVAPKEPGKYALEVAGASGAVLLEDLAFTAAAGTAAAPSSIAAFVNASDMTLVRCDVKAMAGHAGSEGTAGLTGTADKALDGMSADLATAGGAKSCTCSSGGTSNGGAGGGVNSDGQKGGPNIPENPVGLVPPHDGAAGTGNTNCGAGGLGRTGADASNAGAAAAITARGVLTSAGWMPKAGAAGAAGQPGQGGGGGGGRAGGGGGGACGGCGGTGGKGGGGGGASVALLSFNSSVKLRGGTLASASAGAGGKGGGPGTGAAGGSEGAGGNVAPIGCPGGTGGKGGDGGAGAGGAGGISAAALYRGTKPTIDGTLLTSGDLGAKGLGGASPTNDGVDGVKGDIVEAPAP